MTEFMINVELNDDCRIDNEGIQTPISVETENPSLDKVPTKVVSKPYVGLEFDTVNESEELWKKYGYDTGFGGRIKWTNTRKKDNIVTSRLYVCCREGNKAEDKRRVNSKPRFETRCNCEVLMQIKLTENEKYNVKSFVDSHNHELEGKETIYQLRAHQSINNIQAHGIDVALRSGLGPTMTHRYMTIEAGGSKNMSFTKQKMKSHMCAIRIKNMKMGEASTIFEHFHEQSKNNPGFFHSYELDSEGQITNFFWADTKMLADYEVFGDMISFDTTFGTNKASRSLGIFCGFNHHRQIVVFGGALLYDETAASFEWLFQIFLDCHGGKIPGIIFTDKDAAMRAALIKVMPTVRHVLCTWHIGQNAMRKLSEGLNELWKPFVKEFYRCIYDILDVDELIVSWRNMAEMFDLQESNWLQRIYEKKDQFCVAYFKDTFLAGTRTTQISESINSTLKKDLGSGLTMKGFFIGFDLFLEDVRNNESGMDVFSRQTFPHITNNYSSILKQAAHTYTPNIFKVFNDQFDLGCFVSLDKYEVLDYPLMIMAKEGGRRYKITYDQPTMIISCTCCLYEMNGYLCSHILKVLNDFEVDEVPSKYIMKRWTLNAKSNHKGVVHACPGLTNAQQIDILNSESRQLVHRVDGDDELFEGRRRIFNSAHHFIDEYLLSKKKGEEKNSRTPFETVRGNNGVEVTGFKKKLGKKTKWKTNCFVDRGGQSCEKDSSNTTKEN